MYFGAEPKEKAEEQCKNDMNAMAKEIEQLRRQLAEATRYLN